MTTDCGHPCCDIRDNEWHSHVTEPDECRFCHPDLADPNVRHLYSEVDAGDTESGHALPGAASG